MPTIKYKFWHSDFWGFIRCRIVDGCMHYPEIWQEGRWHVGTPNVVDAITGMGEDPWSCGEFADEIPVGDAIEYAERYGIDPYAENPDYPAPAPDESKSDGLIGYFDWISGIQKCANCGWSGGGSQALTGKVLDYGAEFICPKCHKKIQFVGFPTADEVMADPRASTADKQSAALMLEAQQSFSEQKLESSDQLPELDPGPEKLTWDVEIGQSGVFRFQTIIRDKNRIIWREPGLYEGYQRFVEIAQILFEKYGETLRDLEPTDASEDVLYGDKYRAEDIVDSARECLSKGQSPVGD